MVLEAVHPVKPELRNRTRKITKKTLPECVRPRAQRLTPTKSRAIFKRAAYPVAVAGDGHTGHVEIEFRNSGWRIPPMRYMGGP